MTEWHHSDSYRAQLEGMVTAKKICTEGIARLSVLTTGLYAG